MYAVIETGGKQYKVAKDAVIDLEKLDGKKADAVNFTHVLLVADGTEVKIGAPYVDGAKVSGEVVRNFKAAKVISFKYRKRKSSKTTKGHRQQLTQVRIKEIIAG